MLTLTTASAPKDLTSSKFLGETAVTTLYPDNFANWIEKSPIEAVKQQLLLLHVSMSGRIVRTTSAVNQELIAA